MELSAETSCLMRVNQGTSAVQAPPAPLLAAPVPAPVDSTTLNATADSTTPIDVTLQLTGGLVPNSPELLNTQAIPAAIASLLPGVSKPCLLLWVCLCTAGKQGCALRQRAIWGANACLTAGGQ